jgi:CCR4-NOT transcription complex subunit 4
VIDDQGLLSLDEATSSVDALVADSSQDDFIVAAMPDIYDRVSRTSTPSIPPGLSLLHAHPQVDTTEGVVAKPVSRILPTTAPFQPARTSSFIPRATTPLAKAVNVPSQTIHDAPGESSTAQNKQDVKNLATSSGLSKAIASQATQSSLKSEDFPALESGKVKSNTPMLGTKKSVVKAGITPKSKKSDVPSGSSQPTLKAVEKRAVLDVLVPSDVPSSKVSGSPATGKGTVPSSAFPPLPTSTPSVASVLSPLLRKAPTTLRLTATPKTETPMAGSATPSSVTSMFPPTFPPTRQPSLASVSRMDRPGTPTSEMLSDNASITSASMSRASSPPPSNLIGSAPVRMTTKSMQKKQRKEVQRERERAELEATAPKPEKEAEIAPILGRKKKVKKDRTIHSAAGGSTPVASRPPSPGPSEQTERPKVNDESTEQSVQAEDKNISTDSELSTRNAVRTQDSKAKGKAKLLRQPSPEPTPAVSELDEDAMTKPAPTPASILKELVNEGAVDGINELAIFRPPPSTFRLPEPVTDPSINQKLTITLEDRTKLLAGQPVHKAIDGAGRIMLTPNGDCVRNLTEEEENKYLDLQARLAEQSGASSFVSSRHSTSNGFTMVESRAVANGPPSWIPPSMGAPTPMDPVAKINRDEALAYINQYVLPSLSNSMQEQALNNNNTLDPDVMRTSGASATWPWVTDATAHLENNEGAYGPTNREGMIATGIESMTAHFAISGDMTRNTPSTVSLLSLTESETAMQHARKDAEALEKRLNALIKKNRRLVLGASH